MKRTEIIIETQRVTVIHRRRRSNQSGYDAGLADIQVIDIADSSNRTSADEEFGNNRTHGEEKDPCTDSRNR
jgi:hypothetical protein